MCTPARAAASMRFSRSPMSISRSSMKIFGMLLLLGPDRRGVRAPAVLEVRVELMLELLEEALDRHDERIGEHADRLPHHVVAQTVDEIDLARGGATALDAPQDVVHPGATLAARRALAARLLGIEARDDGERPDHASALFHDDAARRSQHGAGGGERLVIEV